MEACSLSGDDLATRLADLKVLLGQALARERLDDVASFRFRGEDEAELRDLVQKEQECCGFWRFSIERDGSEVIMRVGVASPQFAHFVDRFYELARAEQFDRPRT
jgi:hypothetical protein